MRIGLLWCCLFGIGMSQSPKTASIFGIVKNTEGVSISNTSVELFTNDYKKLQSTRTDSNGRFKFEKLAPGGYFLRAKSSAETIEKSVLALYPEVKIEMVLKFPGFYSGASIRVLKTYLQNEAGSDAVDCGYVELGRSPESATKCAVETFNSQRPFFVSYQFQGIDSEIATGVVFSKSGKFQLVDFDSMGREQSNLAAGQTASGSHLIVTDCTKPKSIERSKNGHLMLRPPCGHMKESWW